MTCVCVYVDGGKGHYVPARTVKTEFERMGYDARLEEFFDFLDVRWLGRINKLFWRTMLRNSKIENKVSRCNDSSNGMQMAINYGISHRSEKLLSYVEEVKPDLFFTTHPYAGTVISEMLAANNINIPVYYFATDVFSAPIASITNKLRRFYISTEEGREKIIKMGMEPDKVVLSPFPLQQRVKEGQKLTKSEARKLLGLKEDVFTMQFNLGGEGLGAIEIIRELRDFKDRIQVVIIGGLDDEMKRRIDEIKKNLPDNINLFCPGFIENVNEYLAASDIIVGRSGINTLLEAFYARRPFLITELVYTVMSSADYVEKYHVGWNCNRNPEKQVEIIRNLVEHPEILDEMDKNFDLIPIEFDAASLAKMVISDANEYKMERH